MIMPRIMVVEDENIVARDLEARLLNMGYEVTGVVDIGQRAVDRATSDRPDLILMDIVLKGGMDGVEAAERIRRTLDIPVVYLTAMADEGTLQRAKITEPFGYVQKPFEERELRITIEMALFRHRLEEQIKESRRRFETTLESIGDAVIATDIAGAVTFMNEVAEHLTGWSRRDALGRDLEDVFKAEDEITGRPAENPASLTLRMGFATGASTHMLLNKNGSEIPVEDSASPIKDERGETTGTVLVFRDITQRRRVEQEARERQDQLIQANKMASLGTMVSGVAHEINNPNNFIMFNATLLKEAWHDALGVLEEYYEERGDFSVGGLPYSEMKDIVPRLIRGISDGGQRIKSIVENLRNFTQQDKASGGGDADLNEVVSVAASILSHQINKYTSKFSIELCEPPPRVKGSAQQLEQVVINLIMNSLQALPGKHCGVSVSTSVEHEVGRAEICITDEGRGMSPDVLERITEPFFTTRHGEGGTGLGLSISYSIVKAHNAVMDFSSEPGLGTRATLRMPMSESGQGQHGE